LLILTRKRNERIMIGDSIEVIVVDIRGEQVQLGINAPKTVPVHRREVYEAIVRENGHVVPKTSRKDRLNNSGNHECPLGNGEAEISGQI
jgi:carbon storage regulator CsrA